MLWTADEIRRVGYHVVYLSTEHMRGLPNRPVFRPFPVELAAAMLAEAGPVEGSTPTWCCDFANQVEPYPFGNRHPRFTTR